MALAFFLPPDNSCLTGYTIPTEHKGQSNLFRILQKLGIPSTDNRDYCIRMLFRA